MRPSFKNQSRKRLGSDSTPGSNMHGLKSGSCRFWQRTDLPPGSNMHGLKSSSCRFWQRTDLPYGLKHAAPSCADLLGLQTRRGSNHFAAHVGESNSRSNVFQIRHSFVCVSSRWKVLSGEFRRRPTSLAIKFHKSDRVGRRGLSEPREDFSRLNTDVFPSLHPPLIWGLFQPLTLLSACDISRGLALCFRQVVERDLLRTLKSFH